MSRAGVRNRASHNKRLVWRISEEMPLGEWVDSDSTPLPARASAAAVKTDAPEIGRAGYMASSIELLDGPAVCEIPGDTVPGDLFDELFGLKEPAQKSPER
jgi:hypothetical protein